MWVKDECGNWMLEGVVLGANQIITPTKTVRLLKVVKPTSEEDRLKYFNDLDKLVECMV
jgi:hypothetical protein